MLRSILTQFSRVVCIGLLCVTGIEAQMIESFDCLCTTDNINFEQDVLITADPNDTWTIVSTENFFFSVDPYVDFVPGTEVVEAPPASGNYLVSGFRISGGNSSISVTNGEDMLTYMFPYACTVAAVEGDSYICEGDLEFYEYFIGPNASAISWSAPGLNVLGATNEETLTIDYSAAAAGIYTINVSGMVENGPGNPLCPFNIDYDVEVSDNFEPEQLACNNLVQLSLSGTCELEITADMFLEGTDINNDAYTITIRVDENGEALASEVVTMEYLGVLLLVEVQEDCGGNRCWGNIIVEDKSAPSLICPPEIVLTCDETTDPFISGIPVPMGVDVIQIDDNTFLVEDFDFCGDAILTYYDEYADNSLCEGPYGAVLNRIWIVTDNAGNTNSCTQVINVERADLLDVIIWPPNFDDVLPDSEPSLMACGDWPALENGHPHPDSTGYPIGVFCANVELTFDDTWLEKCGDKSFKVIRKWEVRDICGDADDVLTHNQYITVKDDVAPVFKPFEEDQMEVFAEGHTCISDIIVPAPELLEPECSEWDYYVGYKFKDESDDPLDGFQTAGVIFNNAVGLYEIENIPALNDTVWIIYVLEDVCGNQSTGVTEIVVVDKEQPVPVCDVNTNIGLNEHGESHAGVRTFDDGSWDNCALSYMEVRRMDGAPCGGDDDFSDKVYFCCDDLGKEVMVQLRVWDAGENSNECMVSVFVQDNIPPMLMSCPPSREIDCDVDLNNIPLYGEPVFTDECGFTVSVVDTVLNAEECNLGTIVRRTFTATDNGGNTETCVQMLTLVDFTPFDEDDIDWPEDIEMFEGCIGADIDPDNLPEGFDKPEYTGGGCDMLADAYTDVIFLYVDGVCQKVLRKWTVINNCTHEKWTHTQTIKVTNEEGPSITCDDVEITDNDITDCFKNVKVTAIGSDDCTADDDLEWFYIIDEDPDLTGTSSSFMRSLSFGFHSVVWTVEDECGNVSTCTTNFEIEDTKAPTPICYEYVITTIKDDLESEEIWALDFIKEAVDDCSHENDILYSFEPDEIVDRMVFGCEYIQSGSVDTIELNIYVFDESGNSEFCTSNLILQDNFNYCGNEDEEEDDGTEDEDDEEDEEELQRVNISGSVYTEANSMMPSVELSLSAEMPDYPISILSNEEGSYAFSELDMYMDYSVEAKYDGSYLDGVSTLDLVLMQKHILGTASLDSPYKIIAADANNSESVTALDLVEIRKLILGIYEALPNNDSWQFVEESFVFPDPDWPFPYEKRLLLNDLEHDAFDSDFIAIKIGDVNNSNLFSEGIQAENRSDESSIWYADKRDAADEIEHTIDFVASEDNLLAGFQLSINLDALDLQDIEAGVLKFDAYNYHFNGETIKLSWHTAQAMSIKSGDVLFSLRMSKDGLANDMNQIFQASDLRAELYTIASNGELSTQGLKLQSRSELLDEFHLYQNVPNPFSESTIVSFNLPSNQLVNVSIADYTGRLIYKKSNNYKAGYNEIVISKDELNTSGILYLKLETNSHTATQRMILIK